MPPTNAPKRVITPDGTIIENGVSRPAGVCEQPPPRPDRSA